MEKQHRPKLSYYVKHYTILSRRAEEAIALMEMGQPEKAKESLRLALMQAEEEFLEIEYSKERTQEFYDDLDADYPDYFD